MLYQELSVTYRILPDTWQYQVCKRDERLPKPCVRLRVNLLALRRELHSLSAAKYVAKREDFNDPRTLCRRGSLLEKNTTLSYSYLAETPNSCQVRSFEIAELTERSRHDRQGDGSGMLSAFETSR